MFTGKLISLDHVSYKKENKLATIMMESKIHKNIRATFYIYKSQISTI